MGQSAARDKQCIATLLKQLSFLNNKTAMALQIFTPSRATEMREAQQSSNPKNGATSAAGGHKRTQQRRYHGLDGFLVLAPQPTVSNVLMSMIHLIPKGVREGASELCTEELTSPKTVRFGTTSTVAAVSPGLTCNGLAEFMQKHTTANSLRPRVDRRRRHCSGAKTSNAQHMSKLNVNPKQVLADVVSRGKTSIIRAVPR